MILNGKGSSTWCVYNGQFSSLLFDQLYSCCLLFIKPKPFFFVVVVSVHLLLFVVVVQLGRTKLQQTNEQRWTLPIKDYIQHIYTYTCCCTLHKSAHTISCCLCLESAKGSATTISKDSARVHRRTPALTKHTRYYSTLVKHTRIVV